MDMLMREMQLPAARPEEADAFRAAGKIAGEARKLGAAMIQPGIRLEEVILEVEAFIRSQGAGIGFPAQTSRNHVAAHYCPRPGDPTVYCENDVAKLDVGVVVDGYLADTAQTVHLGDDPRLKRLIDASASALAAAIEVAGPGVPIKDLSTVIEETILERGFRPVYNLTGHGIARWRVHTPPSVPASPDPGQKDVLRAGMVIAVEPFATDGEGHVHDQGKAEVFMLSREPRKMKGIHPEAWAVIEELNGLPFARRSFTDRVSGDDLESSLMRLLRTGCISAYPPLVDPNPEVRIAQTEHSLLITEDGVEVLTA